MREVTFTIAIHPLRWLRSMAFVAVCAPLLLSPRYAGRAADEPTQEQAARQALVARIEAEIRPKMAPKATLKEIAGVAAVVVDESARAGIDPLFVLALIESESGFDIEAVSRTGARGLMQLVPSTFRKVSSSRRVFDPVENVRAGIRYVSRLSAAGFGKRGGPPSVILAYNQGPGRAAAYFQRTGPMPEEAARFIPRVMQRYHRWLTRFGEDPRRARTLFRAPAERLASL